MRKNTPSSEVTFRPLAPGEETALATLWFSSWASIGLEVPLVTEAELCERVPRELTGRWGVTVAERGGELLGFLAIAPEECRLDQLFVAPNEKGLGIGTALFRVAIELLPKGFWLRTHSENGRARAFYESRGMVLKRLEMGTAYETAVYTYGDLHSSIQSRLV